MTPSRMVGAQHSVWIDHRERNSRVKEALAERPGVEIAWKTLNVGDYRVDDTLVIERKTLADFAASLIDQRLFVQAARLAQLDPPGVIILEGTERDGTGPAVRREAVQGALITLSLIYGLPILRSRTPSESAQLILYAAEQLSRVTAEGIHRPGYRPKRRRARQIFILQGLPGVGPKRAASLLDTFASVEKVIEAPVEALAAVDGIGLKTARQIRSIVQERPLRF